MNTEEGEERDVKTKDEWRARDKGPLQGERGGMGMRKQGVELGGLK